jgi:hypothetical protein
MGIISFRDFRKKMDSNGKFTGNVLTEVFLNF